MAPFSDLEAIYRTWIAARSSPSEVQVLDQLLQEVQTRVRIVIRAVNNISLRPFNNEDLQDAAQTAMLKLYRKLRSADASSHPDRLTPYVNQAARNAFHDLNRRANPLWFTLAARVLWRIRHSRRLIEWLEEEQRLCALANAAGTREEVDRIRLEAVCERLRRERDWSRAPLEELLVSLLTFAAHPLPFELLVDLAALTIGEQRTMQSLDDEFSPGFAVGDILADSVQNPEEEVATTELLHWVWNQIDELPDEQRQVCGLDLERAVGLRLEIFVLRGVANLLRYQVLIRPVPVNRLSKFPPIADAEIATLIRLSIKQVYNRRSSAQQRIARRLLDRFRKNSRKHRPSASCTEGAQSRT